MGIAILDFKMNRILQTYVVVILCIIYTQPQVLFDNCKVLKSEGCSQCSRDSSTFQNTLCSLHVMVRTSRILDMNRRDYFYSWFYNGTRMNNIITPDNNRFIYFSGKQDEKVCNDMNSCAMEINLQLNLPKPFSMFNYGNYTLRFWTKTEPEEEVSCSTLVCANTIIGRIPDEKAENNNNDNNEETNGIIIQYSHVYIITSVVVFCLVIIIVLMCAVLRIQRKASKSNRRASRSTQHQISEDEQDDQISSNEISTAISNHIYASIQRSGLSRYQALLDRNLSTHRYDEPTSEQTLGNESSNHQDDVQEMSEIRRQLSRSPGHTVNILASELRNALSREQTEDVPDIIVHDYQNIRRTRRLT